MSRRLAFVIAAGSALGGCCMGSGCYIQPRTYMLRSWDGLASLPKRNNVKPVKVRKTSEAVASEDESPSEEELAKLRPYSKEWGAALDAMNRAADAKLKKQMIICRGCMPPEQDNQTGSLHPNR